MDTIYVIAFWLICSIVAIVWLFYDIKKHCATYEESYQDGEVKAIYKYKDKHGDWVTVYKLKNKDE